MMSHSHNLKSNQRGVTLLLTILITAAISAIVLSIAAIALNEIRTSADLTKSEPVITATEAMAEDQLYKSMRGLATLANCSTPSTQSVNGVTVSSCISYYLENPYKLNISSGDRRDFYLYEPTNQNAGSGYTSVSVTITAGINGTVYFCRFTVVDCIATPDSVSVISTSGPTTFASSADPAQKYQLIIANGTGSAGSYTITTAPNGLPAGSSTIVNNGKKQGVTRKLQVTVPQ